MEAIRSGGTAETVAFMRALHLLVDDDPKILEDPLASTFLDSGRAAALQTTPQAYRTSESCAFRAIFVVRQRYAEDQLADAMVRGVRQYVILGAGLDSLAYRRRDWQKTLQIYEVDRPEVQQWKRQRLAELGIKVPKNLTFVPLDLETGSLSEALAASPHRRDEPTFYSWLGVTQYLSEGAVFETLRSVSSLSSSGSEIVFQIMLPRSGLNALDAEIATTASQFAARRGEHWRTFLDPLSLESRLREMGFTEVLHFGAGEASIRYLQGRSDGLWLPNAFDLITARTGPDIGRFDRKSG